MNLTNSRHIAVMLLTSAAMLTACSSDDDTTNPVHTAVHRPFTVVIGDNNDTRAAITTTQSLSSFNLYGKESSFTFTKSQTDWIASPTNEWPINAGDNEIVDFYAYSHGNFSTEDKSLAFTVSEDAFNQEDLIVATNSLSYSGCNGKVNLVFDHICTGVSFNIYLTKTLNTALNGNTLTVKSVVLSGVKNSGTYNFSNGEWSDVEGNANYTLTNGNLTITTESQALPCGYIFMIPQTFGNESTAAVNVTYQIGNGEEKVATFALKGNTWTKNSKSPIDLKLTTSKIQL